MQKLAEQQALSREFVFPGSLESLPAARDAVVDFVHEYCTDEQQEIDILLALQEALANAMLHGCQNDGSKLVQCTVEITSSEMMFTIQDPGAGFDTGSATDETEDGTNLTQHGRGIFLIRSLMDEVRYSKRSSRIEMKKFRTAAR